MGGHDLRIEKRNKEIAMLSAPKVGLPPGSPVYVGDKPAQPTVFQAHIFDKSFYQYVMQPDLADIAKAVQNNQQVWLDLHGLDNIPLINALADIFAIHPLVIEDILNTKQRPKLDILPEGLFIVFKLLKAHNELSLNEDEQFSLIIKKNLLITFRESDCFKFTLQYDRLRIEHSIVREHDVDYLMYLLIDSIVDNYLHIVDHAEGELDSMEETIIHYPDKISLSHLYAIKRRNMTLRKTIAPLRDIVHLFLTNHAQLINPNYLIYYRDLHDHCLRLVELINLHHEMTTDMQEIYLSTLNTRMNETMKVLTLFASLFIPLTFISGVYGMNFHYMPELEWHYGYPTVLSFMAVLAGGMLFYFRRKKLI